VTGFGDVQGTTLVAHVHKKDETFFRILDGTRDEAIAHLDFEDSMRRWLLRLAGFLMMWFGMQMVFGPLHAVAGILPIAKTATQWVVGGVTFLIALPLSIVTIVISMIMHSWIAIAVVTLLTAGGVFYSWKKRQGAPAGMAAMGPPPGPPPGGSFGGPMGPPPGPPPGGPMGPPPGPPPG